MKKAFFLFIALHSITIAYCQPSSKIFTIDSFIQQIKLYHPLVKQANIQISKSEADLLIAKSAFDPTLSFETSQKTFDGKNYYYYNNPELKVPLPIGNFKTGTENNGGQLIATETGQGKNSYAGIELPLAKGLLIDKRRATIQQSKIFIKQTIQQKNQIINDVLFEAYNSYWQWAGLYQLHNTYSKFLQNSINRFNLVKIAATNGDRSSMDTLEAYTQIQSIQLQQSEILARLNNATIELSNFLWQANDSAYILPNNFLPDTLQFSLNTNTIALADIVDKAMGINPTLKNYSFKLQQLQIEKKLKFQSLLPTLNVSTNLLSQDYYTFKSNYSSYLQNNNKFGLQFKMPLFIREGRGEYKNAKLKIQETNYALMQKKWEIQNKIRVYYNDYTLLTQQLQTMQSLYNNYNGLLKNEMLRFVNGESSLFIINARENKALEALQKNIELKIKLFKAKYAIDWAAGLLQ